MDEFESRAVLPAEEAFFVDPLQRIMLLREAASSELLGALKIRKELAHFFGRSDALFKFYEELSAEGVSFDDLRQADAYAEFDTHLDILEALLQGYHSLLKKHGMTDKVFLPTSYRLNKGFLQNYTKIEIFLEGYLSRYELTLLAEAATVTPVILHYQTSRFNQKMQQRFEELGIALPNDSEVSFDLGAKRILKAVPATRPVNAAVIASKERIEQVSLALEAIEKMVREGIAPEHIALVLPDELFK
ncbi:MAG: PD-(D/E)XK nuclease family protein, partial [Sulfurovum sp.]